MNIGRIVRTNRQIRGLSQSELAHQAGVSLPNLQRIEAGRANPGLLTVKKILDQLKIQITFQTEPVDWDELSALGFPIASQKEVLIAPNLDHLIRAVLSAAIELSSPYGAKLERERDSLIAVLWVLRHHYAPLFDKRLKGKKIIQPFLPDGLTGPQIKLQRIVKGNLCRYL